MSFESFFFFVWLKFKSDGLIKIKLINYNYDGRFIFLFFVVVCIDEADRRLVILFVFLKKSMCRKKKNKVNINLLWKFIFTKSKTTIVIKM